MKGKYGLKAMLHLARLPAGALTMSEEVARSNGISKKFLDTILGDLRNAGFVHARKGRSGGYSLARPASEIRVGHVLRVLEGPLAPLPCASRMAYQRCRDCPDEEACSVRLIMLEVRNAVSTVLDERTLEDLARMPEVVENETAELAMNG